VIETERLIQEVETGVIYCDFVRTSFKDGHLFFKLEDHITVSTNRFVAQLLLNSESSGSNKKITITKKKDFQNLSYLFIMNGSIKTN